MSPSDGEAITEREYHLWFARSFCAHLAEERSRPRTYADGGPLPRHRRQLTNDHCTRSKDR